MVTIFWLALFDGRTFPAGTTRRLITLGDFKLATLQAFFDYGRLDTILTFAG